MKKLINLTLELETDDEYMLKDNFIESDLMCEIGCASNFYTLLNFKTEEVKESSSKDINRSTILKGGDDLNGR